MSDVDTRICDWNCGFWADQNFHDTHTAHSDIATGQDMPITDRHRDRCSPIRRFIAESFAPAFDRQIIDILARQTDWQTDGHAVKTRPDFCRGNFLSYDVSLWREPTKRRQEFWHWKPWYGFRNLLRFFFWFTVKKVVGSHW